MFPRGVEYSRNRLSSVELEAAAPSRRRIFAGAGEEGIDCLGRQHPALEERSRSSGQEAQRRPQGGLLLDALHRGRARRAVLVARDEEPLVVHRIEPDVPEHGAHRAEDRDVVVLVQVVELDPLLEDPSLREARFRETIEVGVVERGRPGEPDA